jgi:hypothetical protein
VEGGEIKRLAQKVAKSCGKKEVGGEEGSGQIRRNCKGMTLG